MNWKPAKAAVAAFEKTARAGALHLVRAGLELVALYAQMQIKQGGDRKSKQVAEADTWAGMVEMHLGISPDTAGRWMRAARGFLATQRDESHCNGLVDDRWWEMPAKQRNQLLRELKKFASQKSLKDLVAEWARLTAAAPVLQGGDTSGQVPSPEQIAIAQRESARSFWQAQAMRALQGLDSREWSLLEPEELAAVAHALSEVAARLKKAAGGAEPKQDFIAPQPKAAKARVVPPAQLTDGKDPSK